MASTIIHIAIANEIAKKINIKNKRDYILGSIAPDISKHINQNRSISHFIRDPLTGLPDTHAFKDKYPNFKDNDFLLGYFIHLYTDLLWFKNYINLKRYNESVKLQDGTIVHLPQEEILKLVYQDYTNVNTQIIDHYNLDLSLFYEDFVIPNTNLDEIPIEKLNIVIDQMGIIIENTKEEKPYVFDTYEVIKFIDESVNIILEKIEQY